VLLNCSNRSNNGPATGSQAKKPAKKMSRREQRAKIKENEIDSINKELGKPSQSVIQLRKDRKAVKSQVAAINYANALECRSQV
jgi:hypothetical protein